MEDVMKSDELNNMLTCFLVINEYGNGDIHKFLKMLNKEHGISDETKKLLKDVSNDKKGFMIELSKFATKLNQIRWVLQTKTIEENKKDLILLGEELIKIGNEMIEVGGNE